MFLLVSCVAVALEHEITDARFGSHLGKGECNVFPQTKFGLQRSKGKKDVLLMAIHLRLTLLFFCPSAEKSEKTTGKKIVCVKRGKRKKCAFRLLRRMRKETFWGHLRSKKKKGKDERLVAAQCECIFKISHSGLFFRT